MPPPSSGGIALYQLLKMLETRNMDILGHNSANYVHTVVEAERQVYADRATHLGDADFYDVPLNQLLDSNYLIRRFLDFDPNKPSRSIEVSDGAFTDRESEETTHFSIVDADGNAAAVTTTLNAAFGSKIFVNGSGFLLNNEMDDFSAKPGVPNIYGLIGGEANAIEPLKRMLSSMTPTITERNGELLMVVGSPGGSTIITSVLQVILNVVEFDMSMFQAVNVARFHHQWRPDTVFFERGRFPIQTLSVLSEAGHHVLERNPIGRIDAILVRPDGMLEGAADPRGDDLAKGF